MSKTSFIAIVVSLLLSAPAFAQSVPAWHVGPTVHPSAAPPVTEPRTLMNCGEAIYAVPKSHAALLKPFCDYRNERFRQRRNAVHVRYLCPALPSAKGCTRGDVSLSYLDGSANAGHYRKEAEAACALPDKDRKAAIKSLDGEGQEEISRNQGLEHYYGPDPDSRRKFLEALKYTSRAGCTSYAVAATINGYCGVLAPRVKHLADVTLPGSTCVPAK